VLSRFFGDREFMRNMLKLSGPIALQNLLITSFSLLDTVMVSTIGEASLAAVGFAMAWGAFLNFLIFGITSGASVIIVQYWGTNDIDRIRHTYGISLIFAAIVSFLFGLFSFSFPEIILRMFTPDPLVISAGAPYIRIVSPAYLITAIGMIVSTVLRSTERVKLPLVASIVGVSINVLLNYILIFGNFGAPRLGIQGAAISSLVSTIMNLGVLMGVSLIQKNIAVPPLRILFTFDTVLMKRFVTVCLPVFINEIFWGAGKTIFAIIYGHMGTDSYAALTAYRTVESVMFTLFVGICNATTIMVGKKVGAGKPDEAFREARYSAAWVPVWSVFFSLILILLRYPFMRFFSLGDIAMAIGVSLMLIAAAEQPFRYFNYIFIVGIFRAGGDTKTSLKIDMIGQWCVGIVLAAFGGLVLKLPFLIVYAVAACSESVLKVVLSLHRFVSRKWIMAITEEGKHVQTPS